MAQVLTFDLFGCFKYDHLFCKALSLSYYYLWVEIFARINYCEMKLPNGKSIRLTKNVRCDIDAKKILKDF